jgi:hypothetical protein
MTITFGMADLPLFKTLELGIYEFSIMWNYVERHMTGENFQISTLKQLARKITLLFSSSSLTEFLCVWLKKEWHIRLTLLKSHKFRNLPVTLLIQNLE